MSDTWGVVAEPEAHDRSVRQRLVPNHGEGLTICRFFIAHRSDILQAISCARLICECRINLWSVAVYS
jgi:hypothetical protein